MLKYRVTPLQEMYCITGAIKLVYHVNSRESYKPEMMWCGFAKSFDILFTYSAHLQR